MIRNFWGVIAASLLLLSGLAVAADNEQEQEPIELTSEQLDEVSAGTGRDNVALQPWPALFAAGFVPAHHAAADQGVIDHAGHMGVAVPRRP